MGICSSCCLYKPEKKNTSMTESHDQSLGKSPLSAPEHKIVEVTDELVHNMGDIESFGKFLDTKFSFDEHLRNKLKTSSSRILVIGMGGGCDIFMAYSIYLRLNKVLGKKFDILYSNSKSAKFLKTDLGSHKEVTEGLWKLPPEQIVLEKGADKSWYGTSKLSQSIPRHENGSPYIFILPSESKDPAIATKENQEAMGKAFKTLEADFIIGVDTGGDCITGGMDWEESVKLGRDVQMQSAIVKSGIPHLILAFGPCCDGESSVKTMNEAVGRLEKQGCFLGAYPLNDFLPEIKPWLENLNSRRTPNICLSAMMGEIPAENGSRTVDGVEYLKVVRHMATRWIPRTWLSHGLAFDLSATTATNKKAGKNASL